MNERYFQPILPGPSVSGKETNAQHLMIHALGLMDGRYLTNTMLVVAAARH